MAASWSLQIQSSFLSHVVEEGKNNATQISAKNNGMTYQHFLAYPTRVLLSSLSKLQWHL
jgi:hypothetical protein